MNDPCKLCGQTTYCQCLDAECRDCNGEGVVTTQEGHEQRCDPCEGEGWIKCNRGGVECPFGHCYCEAAWERQQEDNASEPPMTADERHQRAYDERQALRSGRPL